MLSFLKKVFGIVQKIFIVVVVYLIIIEVFGFFFSKNKPKNPVDPTKLTRTQLYTLINNENLNSTEQGKFIIGLHRATACIMIGEGCTDNPNDGDTNFKTSVFGSVSKLVTAPYAHPPSSGIYWAYTGLQQTGFVPKTYAAQGIGFAALTPIMDIWKLFRDASYMILVLFIVGIGFMIMFRAKINPQTVISIENSLPRIVISLIIITFSFPIAGLLIDLMYVIMGLGVTFITSQITNPGAHISELTNGLYNQGIGGLWGLIVSNSSIWRTGPAILGIVPTTLEWVFKGLMGAVVWIIIGLVNRKTVEPGNSFSSIPWVGSFLAMIFNVSWRGILGALITGALLPFIISLLVYFTALFVFFRIIFLLFGVYLQVLLLIIFSPLILLFESIPGKGTFGYWTKSLFANLLAFPIVAMLIATSAFITQRAVTLGEPFGIGTRSGPLWMPPFLYSGAPTGFMVLVGIGILFMIPDIVKLVKELLGVKGLPINLSPAVLFGGVGTLVGGTMGLVGTYSSLVLAFPMIREALAKKSIFRWLGSGQQQTQTKQES